MVVAVREYVHARRQILDVFVYAILLVMVGNGCLGVACHDAKQDAVCGEVLLWRDDLGGEVAIGAM